MDKPYNEEILEVGLPSYIVRDIEALKKGIEDKVSYVDCLYNELQGSINSAEVDGVISTKQADYLYKKYLGSE